MLRLLRHLARGRPVGNAEAYGMTILRNLARERWRRAPWDILEEHHALAPPEVDSVLACADLHRAIARLPEPQAALIALVAEGETSPRRIAEATGLPVGTVMSRLARARARLRADLAE
jgi:RNA polymerase sigma-70 factor (ECF subfamily)